MDSKLKIGILTFHFSNNCGALLQAYALRTWLRQAGYDADFLNYHPAHVELGGGLQLPFSKAAIAGNVKSIYLGLSSLTQRLAGSALTKKSLNSFRVEQLGITGPAAKTSDQIPQLADHFDFLICGSDQIWNPSPQFGIDPVYFLSFPNFAKRRISYAASFGSSELNLEYRHRVGELLANLDAISVREESGVRIVEGFGQMTAVCVPDPTFLLEGYESLVKPSTVLKGRKLFAYVLRSGDGFREMSAMIASKMNLSIISAHNPHRRWRDVGSRLEGGPIEWLSNLKDSEIVLTNSFHGTVFSILMNRPFVAVRLPGGRAKLSGRLENLLEKVGLSDRLIPACDLKAALKVAATPINWASVNESANKLRKRGRAFLADQISMVKRSI